MTGTFITFEGPDGAGKTSAIAGILAEITKDLKSEPLLTREPGGSVIAEKIRQIILDPENTAMDDRTEALLYAAARRQHLVETILPALAVNDIVISDRFVDSSLAYQGGGRQLGLALVAAINAPATDGLVPDLTLYFDVDPEVGLARIKKNREGTEDRLEQEKIDFHQRVTAAYQKVLRQNPDRIVAINANQDLPFVIADSVKIIRERLPQIFQGGTAK